jgi:hypothetical protein
MSQSVDSRIAEAIANVMEGASIAIDLVRDLDRENAAAKGGTICCGKYRGSSTLSESGQLR